MITRVSSVIRPEGSDLISDHPYNADFVRIFAADLHANAAHRLAILSLPETSQSDHRSRTERRLRGRVVPKAR